MKMAQRDQIESRDCIEQQKCVTFFISQCVYCTRRNLSYEFEESHFYSTLFIGEKWHRNSPSKKIYVTEKLQREVTGRNLFFTQKSFYILQEGGYSTLRK